MREMKVISSSHVVAEEATGRYWRLVVVLFGQREDEEVREELRGPICTVGGEAHLDLERALLVKLQLRLLRLL